MKKKPYVEQLAANRQIRFEKLVISDIDNEPILKVNDPKMADEETCLFYAGIKSGDDYFQMLHDRIAQALHHHQAVPVVRFADGEYAFYRYSLACNGLYRQAESIKAIKQVMPQHIRAMTYLAAHGLFAPLIFPGNIHRKPDGLMSFLKKKKDASASDFLDVLADAGIQLTRDNYMPFYVIYAYLASAQFTSVVDGKKICILNSKFNEDSCRSWFAAQSSSPLLHYVPIPAQYVATRWAAIQKEILAEIPPDTDLCLVGAGVGALLVCVDVVRTYAIPAIDAGHVLNMMNGRVDKSNGARLYTLRKDR
jgi:hypothetical protein